jgi:hypothetical protein
MDMKMQKENYLTPDSVKGAFLRQFEESPGKHTDDVCKRATHTQKRKGTASRIQVTFSLVFCCTLILLFYFVKFA